MGLRDNLRHEIQPVVSCSCQLPYPGYGLVVRVQPAHQLGTKPFGFIQYDYSKTMYH
jgi:hypothetical protein